MLKKNDIFALNRTRRQTSNISNSNTKSQTTISKLFGPTQYYTNILRDARRKIGDEYRELQTHTWKQIVQNIDLEIQAHHRHPSTFFRSVKRLQGNHKQDLPYIKDHDINKIHNISDKEELFRSF